MPRFTRRIKRNKKNRTFKIGGSDLVEERKGIFDIIGDKIGDVTSSVIDKAQDIGLNAMGLEKIVQPNEMNNSSNIGNVVDKTSSVVLNNVNEVLASKEVSESVKKAGEETAAITGKLAETFNDAMDDPVVKAEVKEAIENAGEVGTIVAKAAEEPVKEATRVSVEAGTKALGAASAGVIKVGTDMLAAIPGVGGIIEVGKMINDGSKAASAVVEAGSDAVETVSDAFMETSEKVKEGLKELEDKKKMVQQISNRTNKSISQFENPLQSVNTQTGGRKTKRRLFKRKAKSKRVRFAN